MWLRRVRWSSAMRVMFAWQSTVMLKQDPMPETARSSALPEARPMLGIAQRLAAMLAVSIMFALVKWAGQHGVHVIESLFWRQLAGLPVVILWLWSTGRLSHIRTAQPGAHALRAILGVTAMGLNFLAMTLIPMAEATTISFATPIFATLLAALLLGEATGRYRWAAILVGFIGVIIALQPGAGIIHPKGAAVALVGAMITAGVTIQLRRMSAHENSGAIVFWFSLSTLPPLALLMPFVAQAHDGQTWAVIAAMAAAGAVAQLLLTSAMRHAPVAAILTMDYSALIWSVLLGFWVFGDMPSASIWLGAPIIIGAGLFIAWREQILGRKPVVIPPA